MQSTALEAIQPIPATTSQTAKSKGGKQARQKRADNRRASQNSKDDVSMTAKSQGLPLAINELLPACATRPGGIYVVAPIGYQYFYNAMLTRMRSVA